MLHIFSSFSVKNEACIQKEVLRAHTMYSLSDDENQLKLITIYWDIIYILLNLNRQQELDTQERFNFFFLKYIRFLQ